MKGFTLVELIVTVVIVMVLMGIGSVYINNFSNSKKLETVTDELVNQIKLAKNMAVTGQLPSGGNDLVYVGVTTLANGTITAKVNNSSTLYFSKKIDSMNDLTLTATSFGFAVGTGRLTDINGTFINGPVNLGVSGSATKTVIITDLGTINAN
ncbi:MAG: prepilin-type N-terminal cleavage/methylation domain-containing protein [Candidatus Shapirobacteria bacterium]|jgi:Tfp pilus assembly protein FimT